MLVFAVFRAMRDVFFLIALSCAFAASSPSGPRRLLAEHKATSTASALETRVDADLARLRVSILEAGSLGADRFGKLLPHLLSEVQGEQPATSSAAGSVLKFGASSQRQNQTGRGQSSSCIFDDAIFSLTPKAKEELNWEIWQPENKGALDYVRRGGWWGCAQADHATPIDCYCQGNARLVDIDRKQLSDTIIDAAASGGKVTCTSLAFGVLPGNPLPSMDAWRGCECAAHSATDGSSPDGFHLEKKFTSKSYIQEAWIMLTRLAARMNLLPTGTGDKTYHGIENWAARMPSWAMNNWGNHIFERFWVTKFVRESQGFMTPGKCLEWGDPQNVGKGFNYVNMVPGCTEPYDMQFDSNYWEKMPMHVTGNVVHSDILSLPAVLGPHLRMNTIFATQVFEHIADPLRSAAALFEALAPGGTLVFTAPQSAPFHKVPHDYYRYTPEGAKYVLVQAGFCVPNNAFTGGGDFIFTIAAEAGLQVQDFPLEEVDGAYQKGMEQISHSAIGIHVLAFKPPHEACNDPTSGWNWMATTGIRA